MPFKIKISNAAGDSAWRTVANAHIKTSSSVWNRVRAGWIKISNAAGDAGWRRFFIEVSLPVQTTPPTIRVTNTSGVGTIYDGAIASSPRFLNDDLFGRDGVYTNYTSISGRRFSKAVDLDTSIRTTIVNDDRFTSAGGVTVADRLAIDEDYLFYEVVVSNGGDNVINPVSSPILMIKRQPAVDTFFTMSITGNPVPNETLTFNYFLQNYYYNRVEQGNSVIRWWRSTNNTASGTLLKEEVLTNTVTYSDSTYLEGTSTYTVANSADDGFYIVAEVIGVSSWTRNNSFPNGIQVVSRSIGPVQPPYRFSFGKTLHVSSNGYIGLDAGGFGSTVMGSGRNIAILARDLQQWYLAEYSDTNFYYLYFRSYLYGETNSSLNAVDYQIKFYNDPLINYCDVYMVRVGANVTLPSISRGYYGSGNLQYAGTDGVNNFIGTGSTNRIYFGGTPMKTTGVSWTAINDNVWDVIQTWPYPNTLDDNWTSVVSAANQSAPFPTNTALPTLTTNTGNFSAGSTITINTGTWTGTSAYDYALFFESSTPIPDTSTNSKTLTNTNQYVITNADATNVSYYFRGRVIGYANSDKTGNSATARTVTSARSYINPTTTISVGTATKTGFTISGTAGPVIYTSISQIEIYNSSLSLVTTITTGLPAVNTSTGEWSYVWTGGSGNTTYYAKATAKSSDTAGTTFTTGFSASITTLAAKPPKTPTSPTTSGITTTNITFSWTAPTSDSTNDAATGYEYFTDTTNTVTTGNGTATTSTSVNFTYTASTSPTAKYFWVRATNADGKSAWTASVTATPTAASTTNPVVWGTMPAPAFARNTTPASASTSYRWGWNNVLPSSGSYTASNIFYEWQHSTGNSTTTQSDNPVGLIASGSRPNRSAGGLTVGGSTYNNRASSLSGDYNATGNPIQPTSPANREPLFFNTANRYLRYRAVVVGTDGQTYRSNYSAWV